MNNRRTLTGWLTVSTFAAVILTVGCASVRSAKSEADYSRERAQIERRLHEILDAAESKDFNRLDSYHLYGPKFSRFSGSSLVRLDASETRRLEHTGLASLKALKMRMDDLKIDVFGDVGIATFILDYRFETSDEPVHAKERTTLVLVNESGDWRIAHEHLSRIAP